MTTTIEIYADEARSRSDSDQMHVTLSGIEVSEIISEFNTTEILDCLETSAIVGYLADRQREDAE
jgi:hypothetical protein